MISRRHLYAAGLPLGECCTRREAGRLVCGGGDSSSSNKQETTVKDMRVVGGDSSTNISADNSTIIATDHGAVSGGLQVATHAIDTVAANSQAVQDTTKDLYQGALTFVGNANRQAVQAVQDSGAQVAGAFSQAAGELATAYTDSKTPDKSILMVGAVAVVGLAAVMVMARRG